MHPLRKSQIRGGIVLGLALLCAAPAQAQVGGPPTPPVTLWQFLGIPQGIRKVQGATRNRRGNHPNREPKPPLKALADPANLESKDPSIKKAAEIKQAEDLKKQKIKAVKYLASIGCGCYDIDGGVTAALIASMSDCTEDVRYETIKAISEAAQSGCCAKCGSTCCCNKDILMAMARIAYERDDHGCYVEPSERVRQAAIEALQICCPNDSPPVIVPAEEEQEDERETAEEIEEGESRETAPEGSDVPPPTPTPPIPPSGEPPDAPEPLPSGGEVYYQRPDAATAPISAPGVADFGAVIDVSPTHNLAHVHFSSSDIVAEEGSLIYVFKQMGDERQLIAQLQVVQAFPGSANVTGAPEAIARIVRGDMVLPATASPADPNVFVQESEPLESTQQAADRTITAPPAETMTPVEAPVAAAPRTSPVVPSHVSVIAQPPVPAEFVEVTDAQPRAIPKPAAASRLRAARHPVTANFLR